MSGDICKYDVIQHHFHNTFANQTRIISFRVHDGSMICIWSYDENSERRMNGNISFPMVEFYFKLKPGRLAE